MSISREEAKKALRHLDALIYCLPEDVDILSVDIPGRINDCKFEAAIMLYAADLEEIKESFNTGRIREERMSGYQGASYQYFTVNDIAVFQLARKTAALSGTEDSGNEKDVT